MIDKIVLKITYTIKFQNLFLILPKVYLFYSIIGMFQISKGLFVSHAVVYLHFLFIHEGEGESGMKERHKRYGCKVCGRSIGRKSGVYCPFVRIAASNVKGGTVDDGNVFPQSFGTRFISDRIE